MMRLGLIDVGSRGGLSKKYAPYRDQLVPVLIEPERQEFERLRSESELHRDFAVINKPLAHIDGALIFNETVNPHCSSILSVNHSLIDQYSVAKHFAFSQSISMDCARYDTLFAQGNLPIPRIIKIDVQGFESRVLQGFGALLHECYTLELEAHFYPIYEGQKLLHEIIDYLADYGMVLRKLSNNRSLHLNGDHHFDQDLVEVDATFSKTRLWSGKQTEETRSLVNLACKIVGIAANR